MTREDGAPLHPLVAELLGELEDGEDGPRLPGERMRHWAETFAGRGDRREVAVHLVVVAMRFRNHGAIAAVDQMVVLAAAVLGDLRVQALLETQGLPAAEAERVVGQAQARAMSSPLTGGLAPPAGVGFKRGS